MFAVAQIRLFAWVWMSSPICSRTLPDVVAGTPLAKIVPIGISRGAFSTNHTEPDSTRYRSSSTAGGTPAPAGGALSRTVIRMFPFSAWASTRRREPSTSVR